MFTHLAEIGAQADASESEQERPAGKIGERSNLFLVEELIGSQNGDQQEPEHELWKFLPQESGSVGDGFRLTLTGPVDGIGEHHETNHRVARGLGEHGKFSGSVGVKCPRGRGFGSVVYGKAGPQAIGVIAEVQPVSDQRKREERECAEREYRSDRKRGVLFISLDSALGRDDRANTADGGAYGKERGQLGTEAEGAAQKNHESSGAGDFQCDETQAHSAQFEDVTQQKPRAEKNDAGFKPELIRCDTRAENCGYTDRVGDRQADQNGPQNILDIRKGPVMSFRVGSNILLQQFTCIADCREQENTGDDAEELDARGLLGLG